MAVAMQLGITPQFPPYALGDQRGGGRRMSGSGFTHESAASNGVECYTPPSLFEALGKTWTVDVCAPQGIILPWIPVQRRLTRVECGLSTPWLPDDDVWMNPPYNEPENRCKANCTKKRCVKRGYHLEKDDPGTIAWVRKLSEHGRGMALLFSRTDVEWFQAYAVTAMLVCFVKGRLKFVDRFGRPFLDKDGKEGTPGAGSLLLAWGQDNAAALEGSRLGLLVDPRKLA